MPANTLSWMRRAGVPPTWIDTSPSPITSFTTRNTVSGTPASGSRGAARAFVPRLEVAQEAGDQVAGGAQVLGARDLRHGRHLEGRDVARHREDLQLLVVGRLRAGTDHGHGKWLHGFSSFRGRQWHAGPAAPGVVTAMPTVGGRVTGACARRVISSTYSSQLRRPSIAPT